MKIEEEIEKRRTFGIISHPDAGKTTLTEKLLLFGGAIQTAGAVKSNKITKTAASDFMDIERQRGISVATSVMAFEYKDTLINLLDTPGHKDFAEDTFRTLTAVDSVILVIDCVKGVEEQTERLMEVCRMRDTPVIIFINKMDLEGRHAFELLDELEEKLKISVRPLTCPIGIGRGFKGVYKLYDESVNLFDSNRTNIETDVIQINNINDTILDKTIGEDDAKTLRDDVELIEGVYEPVDQELYAAGLLAPVFFGSAINNFGVQELLDKFIEIAPFPKSRSSDTREILPTEEKFTGFVFKIHANVDPRHRDRIAFLRVCSGRFERNKFFKHVRIDKKVKFANPVQEVQKYVQKLLFGKSGSINVMDIYTGDIIAMGSSPSFDPNQFVHGIDSKEWNKINKDPMKSKQLEKGIRQLTDEGVAQLFKQEIGNKKVIGTVGDLQFEVIQYRLKHEYGASCDFMSMKFYKACWITTDNKEELDRFRRIKSTAVFKDKDDNYVFLAESAWMLRMAQEDFPDLVFHFTSEFKVGATSKF